MVAASSSPRAAALLVPSLAVALAAASLPTAASACSMLTFRDADRVLVGNNEDWKEPGYLWFEPGKDGRYGRVNVGFKNRFSQGSMNEKGLVFDAAVVPRVPWKGDPAKGTPMNLLEKIMNECATVEEALEYFEKYNSNYLAVSQFLFADATGDSAVITWRDGALSVERIEGRHLVATNSRLQGTGYRCQRHARAEQVLAEQGEVTVDAVTEVLDALHQQGEYFTTYSTIYDLKAKTVSIYNMANFDEVRTFDLAAELLKKPETYRLSKLFDESPKISDIQKLEPRRDFGTRVEVAAEVLDRYTGVYSPAPDVTVRVERDGGELRVISGPEGAARLFPESERVFRLAPDRGQVTFHVGDDGRVEGMTLHKQVDAYAARVGDL
ncbi:MAG: DUF3471 domain-containing protein [Acidobacteriota bacterium]